MAALASAQARGTSPARSSANTGDGAAPMISARFWISSSNVELLPGAML